MFKRPLSLCCALLFCIIFLCAESLLSYPKICLNMIVKNESHVITRCLESVLPIIDHWVIVDTGSTDGTQVIITEFMKQKQVPGELYERPWVNFEHNRNEALQLAQKKADYLLFIDADDYLSYNTDFKLPLLDKDYYYINAAHSGTKYGQIQLIKTSLNWEWIGVLHEVLAPPISRSFATLENVRNIHTCEGARSQDSQKFQKDAAVLEAALKKEPDNRRYMFYLAQSYRDAGNYPLALQTYKKRVEMGGWDQEVFFSLFQIAAIQKLLEMPSETVISSYYKAFEYRPSRIEPLYYIANHYREAKDYKAGYLAAKRAQTIPKTQDVLFVQQWIYDYGLLLELSICAYWTEHYEECQQICLELLKNKDLPPNVRECVTCNLEFANAKLAD